MNARQFDRVSSEKTRQSFFDIGLQVPPQNFSFTLPLTKAEAETPIEEGDSAKKEVEADD